MMKSGTLFVAVFQAEIDSWTGASWRHWSEHVAAASRARASERRSPARGASTLEEQLRSAQNVPP
jgi:hypothetical protein